MVNEYVILKAHYNGKTSTVRYASIFFLAKNRTKWIHTYQRCVLALLKQNICVWIEHYIGSSKYPHSTILKLNHKLVLETDIIVSKVRHMS